MLGEVQGHLRSFLIHVGNGVYLIDIVDGVQGAKDPLAQILAEVFKLEPFFRVKWGLHQDNVYPLNFPITFVQIKIKYFSDSS